MALVHKAHSAPHKEDSGRPASFIAKTSPHGAGEGGGGAAVRRTSTVMGLTGPKTAGLATTSQTARPTLFGLLASKRLARRFASRFHSRRLTSSSKLSAAGVPPVHKEPTYRMEPYHKFSSKQVEEMLKTLLEEKMAKFHYSAKICANMTKILSQDITNKVKGMNFDRYKIVSNVLIGQKKDQAVITCSRCAWDEKLDSFASYTFQNEHIFCTAIVFGIYME